MLSGCFSRVSMEGDDENQVPNSLIFKTSALSPSNASRSFKFLPVRPEEEQENRNAQTFTSLRGKNSGREKNGRRKRAQTAMMLRETMMGTSRVNDKNVKRAEKNGREGREVRDGEVFCRYSSLGSESPAAENRDSFLSRSRLIAQLGQNDKSKIQVVNPCSENRGDADGHDQENAQESDDDREVRSLSSRSKLQQSLQARFRTTATHDSKTHDHAEDDEWNGS